MASVCGVINAAEGRLVSLIAEALAEGLWAQGGVWSPEGWVAWRCGVSPSALRREVLRRDGGCLVPGCTHRRFLQIHHVIRWKDGGRTEAWNLAAVCHAHHRADHEGRISISGRADDPGGFRVTMPHGPVLPQHAQPVPPHGPVGDAAARLLGRPPPTYRNPIGERLDLHWLDLHPNRPPPAPPAPGPGPDPPHPN